MKIKTFWEAASVPLEEKKYEPVSDKPSLTLQEGYESLDEMIPRIIRGEIAPVHRIFEFGADVDEDKVLDSTVVDDLDDLTDIDVAKDIVSSAVGSARSADTLATAGGSKHGAEEDDKEVRASETEKSVSDSKSSE